MKTLLLLLALIALCLTVTGCDDEDDNQSTVVWFAL
jgi:hypothetical protein